MQDKLWGKVEETSFINETRTLAVLFKLITPTIQKSFSTEANILPVTFYTMRNEIIEWYF